MPYEALGRYRLLNELGRGAMGHVFLAHDPEIDRNVALKTIEVLGGVADADRAETRERVLREARAAGKLLHPGIVTLFDVGETDGTLYLAMEHVEGQTLDHFTKPDRLLPVSTVVEIVAGVAEALEYAHHLGVVHRDIKPANLMRVDETTAKIMDFGLARVAESQITHDGTLMGTPRYMSPEQIRGEECDGRSDLFSLAVVLHEMLAGGTPFPGDTVPSIIYRIVNELPDLDALPDGVAPAIRRFLERALAKKRDDRYPQGGAFAAALREAGAEAAPATDPLAELDRNLPPADLPPRSSSHGRKSSAVPYVVVLLLLIGAAAAAWVFRDHLPLDRLPIQLPQGEPEIVWLETTVRTEPPGLPVEVDGEPLAAAAAGRVRFASGGDPVVVSTSEGCRTVEHTLSEADAGGEVVLLVESTSWEGTFDPGVDGARVSVNGTRTLAAPAELALDLCRANELAVSAAGYREATLSLPEQARPVDVRTALAAFSLDAIPRGTLRLSDHPLALVYYVDGERLDRGVREFELTEGRHELRYKNDEHWIDETVVVNVAGGETVTPEVTPPPLGTLRVQAFPANCQVFLRRPGGSWKYVDDTPSSKRLAAGTYDVRVTFKPTGENKDRTVELKPGDNAPVRVSFSGG